jgi:O-6-methylguanine DNA methyltransferase
MRNITFRDTKIGSVGLEEVDGKIARVYLPADKAMYPKWAAQREAAISSSKAEASHAGSAVIEQAFQELEEYFEGKRKVFSVKLAPQGSAFQMRVWSELQKVGFGELISYGELARRAGSPKGARAVGGAMNRNPIAVFIPCHRVVGADGSMTGFGGGVPLKEKLLQIERA